MLNKKWEELSTDEWCYETEFGCLQVDRGEGYAEYETEDVTGKFRAYWNWEDAEDLGWFDTVDLGKAACIADYNAKVAGIAAANGYIKIEPGMVVMSHSTARKLAVTVKKDHCTSSTEDDMVLWDDAGAKRVYDEAINYIKIADMALTAAIGMPVGDLDDA